MSNKSEQIEVFQGDPWERQSGEGDRSFYAFRQYLLMSPQERSIRKLAGSLYPGVDNSSLLLRWSTKHKWVSRASAFDEREAERERVAWSRRRQEVREADYSDGNQLRTFARKVLAEVPDFVKETRTIDEDGNVVIYKALDGHLLVKILELASKLQRLAAGEPTSNARVEQDLSPEMLDQLIQMELRRAIGVEGESVEGEETEEGEGDEE